MTNKSSKRFQSLRDFPSVEILTAHGTLKPYLKDLTRPVVVQIIRGIIDKLKNRFQSGERTITENNLIAAIKDELDHLKQLRLKPVINGSGIIIHTNLGRAPLSEKIIQNSLEAVTGYSNLEFDLNKGKRGGRGLLIEHLLAVLCETESGTIVNNNAAAVFIILNSLAGRKEVVISRGELIQIGGGFKIPEIMTKSGVRLVEIGTTNKTTIADYRAAVTDRTRMILKVHRSNFAQTGFVEETSIGELFGLCREHDLILTHDLGSGLISFPPGVDIKGEPRVVESIRSGADLTCFSGDKLLGGTQAGLIAGRRDLIAEIKKNPLFRTIRCDKIIFSLMEQVLMSYLSGTQFDDIPIWRMISVPVTDLKKRGKKIISACRSRDVTLVATRAYPGGGSAPARSVPSMAVSLQSPVKANTLAARFRLYSPPIIGRVENDEFLIDLRAVPPEKDHIIIKAINRILG
jgi:L-seryl-tRNA(Ser) seleniumtransferase